MLLGALIEPMHVTSALDIGAGTGVLSLMVLQKNPAIKLEAIEIHPEAAEECSLNFKNSPLGLGAKVHAIDFFDYQTSVTFDLIFSNPPFYLDGLKSGVVEKDQAKHIDRLWYDRFLAKTKSLLSENGRFYVIVPGNQLDFFADLAKTQGLFVQEQTIIHATKEKPNSRVVFMFSREQKSIKHRELTIRDVNGQYTEEYIFLTKDYHFKDLSKKD